MRFSSNKEATVHEKGSVSYRTDIWQTDVTLQNAGVLPSGSLGSQLRDLLAVEIHDTLNVEANDHRIQSCARTPHATLNRRARKHCGALDTTVQNYGVTFKALWFAGRPKKKEKKSSQNVGRTARNTTGIRTEHDSNLQSCRTSRTKLVSTCARTTDYAHCISEVLLSGNKRNQKRGRKKKKWLWCYITRGALWHRLYMFEIRGRQLRLWYDVHTRTTKT